MSKKASGLQRIEQGKEFKQVLGKYVDDVNALQHRADQEIEQLAAGKKSVEDVMQAMNDAEISFKTMMQIRNKLMEAYKDLSRMQG